MTLRSHTPAERAAGRAGAGGPYLRVCVRVTAAYSLSPAVICVAEMASSASEASRHFQSVNAGWS